MPSARWEGARPGLVVAGGRERMTESLEKQSERCRERQPLLVRYTSAQGNSLLLSPLIPEPGKICSQPPLQSEVATGHKF